MFLYTAVSGGVSLHPPPHPPPRPCQPDQGSELESVEGGQMLGDTSFTEKNNSFSLYIEGHTPALQVAVKHIKFVC